MGCDGVCRHPRACGKTLFDYLAIDILRAWAGWRLAPAFDLNPNPRLAEHVLALDGQLRIPRPRFVRETAPFYRLSAVRANELIEESRDAVAGWRGMARSLGITASEIELVAPVFAVG